VADLGFSKGKGRIRELGAGSYCGRWAKSRC